MEAKTVLYAGGESSNGTSYYTQISRAKERVHLAIPDKKKFLEEIIKKSAQVNALDYEKAIEQEKEAERRKEDQERGHGWSPAKSEDRGYDFGR